MQVYIKGHYNVIIDNMGHLYDYICMNDRQYVITDIQEHLYVRKSEYVFKFFFFFIIIFFFFHRSKIILIVFF